MKYDKTDVRAINENGVKTFTTFKTTNLFESQTSIVFFTVLYEEDSFRLIKNENNIVPKGRFRLQLES